MPIFEYKCSACGADFEKLVFGSTIVICPACGSDSIVKKLSVFGMSGVENAASAACSTCQGGVCSSCSSNN